MTALLPLVKPKKSRRFLDQMLKKHDRLMNKAVGAYTRKVEKKQPIHPPEYAASLLDQVAAEDAIFTADTGMCNVWTARYINRWAPVADRLVPPRIHGERPSARHWCAGGLPRATGGFRVRRRRLSMLMGELITVAAHKLPVNVVVFNNSTLGMVKLEMLVDGLPDFGVDVPDANYAEVAKALGFHAVRVTDPADIEAAYRAAFAHPPGPSLVELITDPNALSIPPKISGGSQVIGFATAMSKVVLNRGAGGEAVSMARSNLRNIPRR